MRQLPSLSASPASATPLGARSSLGRAIFGFVFLVAAIALPAASAQAAFPGTNGKIAFAKFANCCYEDGNGQDTQNIFSMNPDKRGSGETNLTNSQLYVSPFSSPENPTFSPDGRKIAYTPRVTDTGIPEIFVMNADGSGQQNLTETPGGPCPPCDNSLNYETDPAFSADGTKIVYRRGDGHLFVINADGTGDPQQLTDTGDDSGPTYSPDGTKIAFLRAGDVWVMDVDGGNETQLTTGGRVGFNLDYSPDGTKLLYLDSVDFTISLMNSANGELITDTGVPGFGGAAFSPDGKKIAYSESPDPPDRDDQTDIWMMDVDGTDRIDVTPAPRQPFPNDPNAVSNEAQPTWQPVPAVAPPPGGGGTPPPAITPPGGNLTDTTKPVLGSLSLSATVFRAAASGPSVSSPVGTRVSYELSEKAVVRFRVERALRGRRVGGRCVRPTRANHSKPRCTRYRTLRGAFSHRGKAGPNNFKFRGRLNGRKLKPGRYRLRSVATDAAGNRSARKRVRFRIARR